MAKEQLLVNLKLKNKGAFANHGVNCHVQLIVIESNVQDQIVLNPDKRVEKF